jgi:hypothetical protein
MRFARLFTGAAASSTVAVVLMLTGVVTPAFGGAVTTLAALNPNDLVDWNVLGANGTNNFTVTSNGGLSVNVSEPTSSFVTTKQNPPGGWFGDFAPGTTIIYDQGPDAPIKITFATPVQGFGVTIDDAFGGGYTGSLTEYDSGASILGTATASSANPALIFLGVLDATADIKFVTIGTTAVGNNQFAFGNLSLVDGSVTPATAPEPATVGTILIGLAVLSGAPA